MPPTATILATITSFPNLQPLDSRNWPPCPFANQTHYLIVGYDAHVQQLVNRMPLTHDAASTGRPRFVGEPSLAHLFYTKMGSYLTAGDGTPRAQQRSTIPNNCLLNLFPFDM